MLNFEKPVFKITDYVENNNYGKFELEPLERGFGTTIGNALRRVMLSNMPGSAIVAVKIDGVMHEFQTIDGVVEDVTTIVLNLKSVVLKKNVEGNKTIHLYADKEGVVTAGDITCDADVEVMNPDQVIATLAKGGKLDMEMIVANGRGYVPANENKQHIENAKIGFIPIDALYSPIERISYEVESARVGQDANYDKLIMNVYTSADQLIGKTPLLELTHIERALGLKAKVVAKLEKGAPVNGMYPDKDAMMLQRDCLTKYGGAEYHCREGIVKSLLIPLIKSDEYSLPELVKYARGALTLPDKLWGEVIANNFFETASKLDVPVLITQGRHDYNTPSEIVSRWIDMLDAPAKEIVWFEESAHSPIKEEPELWGRVIREKIFS